MKMETNVPLRCLQLGAIRLPADAFSVKAEVPVKTRVLCDGTVRQRLLSQTRCALKVSGRMPAASGSKVCAALNADLIAHTQFSFTFADAAFAGMQIVSLEYGTDKHTMTTAFSVTLSGTLTRAVNA